MIWPDDKISWSFPWIIKMPNIKYHHYGFCKNKERFLLKKKWWETRFGKPFDYSWYLNPEGKIDDINHKIFKYTGKHPKEIEENFKKT